MHTSPFYGGDESGDAGDEDKGAQRIGIARGHARRRPARLEASRGGARALNVGVPQRDRMGIGRGDRERVDDRGVEALEETFPASDPIAIAVELETMEDRSSEGRGHRKDQVARG
jgi:hypothetical protein